MYNNGNKLIYTKNNEAQMLKFSASTRAVFYGNVLKDVSIQVTRITTEVLRRKKIRK